MRGVLTVDAFMMRPCLTIVLTWTVTMAALP